MNQNNAPHTEMSPLVAVVIDNGRHRVPMRTTPRALLALAGKSPESSYLVRIDGRRQESFKDDPDRVIRVEEGNCFITVACGPTPVS